MKRATTQPIVLAMNTQMQAHAYGPFQSHRDAELWAKAQNDDPSQTEYQYVVIDLLSASIRVSPTRR